jgi:hypothetical protein
LNDSWGISDPENQLIRPFAQFALAYKIAIGLKSQSLEGMHFRQMDTQQMGTVTAWR